MATWHIIVQKNRFNLAGSSYKEILSNLKKFFLSFKEMCEIGSESPDHDITLTTYLLFQMHLLAMYQ